MSEQEVLQGVLDKFLTLFQNMLKDVYSFFGDAGGQIIIVLFLLLMIILIIGSVYTLFLILNRGLNWQR